jgi:hypothetical protein
MSRSTKEVHDAERAHFDRKADREQRDDDLLMDDGFAKRGRKYLELIGGWLRRPLLPEPARRALRDPLDTTTSTRPPPRRSP